MTRWMNRAGLPVLAAMLMALAACSGGNVFSLDEGTCFDDLDNFFEEGGAEVSDVPIVDCGELHDNEVYALFDLPDGEFPGVSAVGDEAQSGCHDRFEAYVGRDFETSRYDVSWLVPTTQTWDEGDREIVCFLYDVDLAQLEGSARDSGE